MFNNIAPKYDFLNELLSLGIHKGWRKKAIGLLKSKQPKEILDIATGTGDFAMEALKLKPQRIKGIDISQGMLAIGREKIKKSNVDDIIELQLGDSENLPFETNSFDAITVGFGVRNFEHLEIGLVEMHRVLKEGGIACILEFSKPTVFPIKQFYNFYFRVITPLIGKVFSKDNSAYTYLPESVKAFPDGNDFLDVLNKAGFKNSRTILLTFGIASIYIAEK